MSAVAEINPDCTLSGSVAADLLDRAVEALEVATNTRGDTFTGAPAPN